MTYREPRIRYTPTAETIRRRCEAIRAGWTAKEARKRERIKPKRWTLPVVHWDEITQAFVDSQADQQEP